MEMKQLARIMLVSCVACAAGITRGGEGEQRIQSIPGIEVWLDAQREADNRMPAGTSERRSGIPLDRWHDSIDPDLGAEQSDPQRQPQLLPIAAVGDSTAPVVGWVVRFDGVDDSLRILQFNRRFKDFSLFVVAAPHSNSGNYRGFVSTNQRGRKDYETGFNLDMNAAGSTSLQNINLEGRGFGGARNLMNTPVPLGTLQRIEAVADSAKQQIRLSIDGNPSGDRAYAATELLVDEMTIAARHYENGPGAQRVQGFLDGDIAEVILFDRVLSESESQTVRGYLDGKYAALSKALPVHIGLAMTAKNIEPLVVVADPPPVQMLVPGFTVFELPVKLTNINNLRYRKDGKLYALGYNGQISLLSDHDGDTLEDTATVFFENKGDLRGPIGMAVIPDGHALLTDSSGNPIAQAQGVVVASKGKISAIIDRDGDDIADEERVIASGWKEIPQNVDAIGVAIHPVDGSIYFGLGTAAYNNAYLLDDSGQSAFDLGSDRGTIQRIAPDLSQRTTVCTGVRFTIGMEFNADHELFVTEQEGATWLPNGNPFDELLHIQPGRHYGFPPRHPRHLPNVFDQPSLFDYRPQHQSTCGMTFNLPLRAGGPIFGPASWRGNAIVTGESRGKLYRTELLRNQAGQYLANNHLIGCLNMLTVDVCLTPRGDLLVACHSGGPDWGTGPGGSGKLFLIRYPLPQTPQPTTAWAAGPQEVRIAFDRPLDPGHLTQLGSRTKITYGQYVAAGDRFESIRPGYAVTQMQQSQPRYRLPVYSASVTADRTTVILATAPHHLDAKYAITLPALYGTATRGHLSLSAAPASRDRSCVLARWRAGELDTR